MNVEGRESRTFAYFARLHRTPGYTPPVAAEVTDKLWSKIRCEQSDDGKTIVRRSRSGVRSMVYRLGRLFDPRDRTVIWRPDFE
jgi:hypothetical protein